MSDIYTHTKRSDIMSRISNKDTEPELLVRKYLFAHGFRYRKNVSSLPGKPDIVLLKYKTVIFIHGCFWHGHACKAGKLPNSNHLFWKDKINTNRLRDARDVKKLKEQGWHIIVIWQCEIKNRKLRDLSLLQLLEDISSQLNRYSYDL